MVRGMAAQCVATGPVYVKVWYSLIWLLCDVQLDFKVMPRRLIRLTCQRCSVDPRCGLVHRMAGSLSSVSYGCNFVVLLHFVILLFLSSGLLIVTCHMRSHSVIHHSTRVNVPTSLTPSAKQTGTRFTYPGGMKG